MKTDNKYLFLIILFAILSLQIETLKAQANSGNGGNFGIGGMLGEPTGLSIKSWNGDNTAFNIGAAWSLSGRNEAIHLHADFLYHSWFSDINRGNFAFYYGIGGRADRACSSGCS